MNKYTPEQIEAITRGGTNILVSASAGSGKTTVLIERILNKLKNDKWNVDEMLIVTFTEAAANEMKQRLRTKLNQEILNQSKNEHLKKQLMRLTNAQISTFHSFCNSVIQKFFYLIDADAKYKISEDVEIFLMSEEVLENLFNELYEQNDEMFMLLVKRFTSTTHDTTLKNIINDIYNKLRTLPFKDIFINEVFKHYQIEGDLSTWTLYPYVKDNLLLMIKNAEGSFKKARTLAEVNGHPYANLYNDDMVVLDEIRKKMDTSFDELFQIIKNIKFPTFKSNKKEEDKETNEFIKNLRDEGKKVINKLKEKYFSFGERSNIKFITENKTLLEALLYVIHLYDTRFKIAKKDRNLVDFSDLEEMTLKILTLNNGDNEATDYYKTQFKEILVDEFQDTNSMQETIIRAVSNHQNIFMVGDVKQSIYRFRSAEPEIFQSKYKKYGEENNDEGFLINLNANYRSREEVLDFINFIFCQIMDEAVGEITYDEKASLKFGQTSYPKINDKCVSVHILEKAKINEISNENHDKSEIEAHYVAQKIRELIDNETLVFDKGSLRKVTYKDIVILSRTKNEQDVYNEAFKQYNIPFLTQDLAGYFNSIEVLTITSVLRIIDNPLQDIPFVATMRSPLFHINEKELIDIKATSKKTYYYEKVLDYIKYGQKEALIHKLKVMIDKIENWREAIKNESLSQLLFSIYHDTNYYDFVLGQYGGKQRQANLDLLYDRAKDYEHLTSNSLFKFIHLINFLVENDKDLSQARTVSDNEDLVRFMSIHKSKGLEFPIVFITNLSKKYNIQDEKSEILFDKDLGIAFSFVDLNYRVKYDTLYQSVIKDKVHKQMIAEEMRLLYVAFTRAKERLYLVGTVDELEKEMKKAQEIVSLTDIVLPDSERQVTNYLSLILLSMMRHPEVSKENNEDFTSLVKVPGCDFTVISQLDFLGLQSKKEEKQELDFSIYFKEIANRLNFSYPFIEKTRHFAKQTIADVKRNNQGISEYNYLQSNSNFKTPKFVNQNKNDATLRGTTFHLFMQHIDYSKQYTLNDLIELKNKLINQEIISEYASELIDLNKIYVFTQTEIARLIRMEAQKIQKELPFTTLVDSKKVYQNEDLNEAILIQGVIDLFVLFDEEAYILDFKSDRIKDEEIEIMRLKSQYLTQINMYKEAIQKIYPNKNVKALLYFFEINKLIEM